MTKQTETTRSIFNKDNQNWKKGNYATFLDQPMALYDSVNVTYPKMFDLYKLQKSMDWSEDEVALDKDRENFMTCSKNNYDIMIKTLSFQWELDSVASRAIAPLFSPFVTNSELWAMITKQSEIENLHSVTYSEIIRNAIDNPDEVFKEVMHNDEVTDRSTKVVEVFDKLAEAGAKYTLGEYKREDRELKKIILLGMVALYCLEKIQFQSSFACTFVLADSGIFQGIGALVKKIAQDEACMTDDHDVLTPKGWVSIKDVTENDEVAQWDYETREIKFVKPIKKIHKKYTGKLHHLKSSNKLDQLVTHDHRIPVVNPYSKSGSSVDCVFAEDYKPSGTRSIPINGWYDGVNRDMSPIEKLYVAYQADGSYRRGVENVGQFTGCMAMNFAFKKERKIKDMRELLSELNFEYTEYVCKNEYTHFYIKVPLEYAIENEKLKSLDWITFDNIGLKWIDQFMDELSKWDSHIIRDGHIVYGNVNIKAINKIQALAHLSSRKASPTKTESHSRYTSSGELINASDYTRIGIFDDVEYAGGQAVKVNKIDVEDLDVYCLTVPSSYFIVKRNDIVSVTGNCHAQMDKEILRAMLHNEQHMGWKDILNENIDEVKEIIDEVVQQEFDWNKYLFSEGRSVVGLNEVLLSEWVLWNAQEVYDFLGVENEHQRIKTNPLPWMDDWLDINRTQQANQESDNINYRLNSADNDLDDDEEIEL